MWCVVKRSPLVSGAGLTVLKQLSWPPFTLMAVGGLVTGFGRTHTCATSPISWADGKPVTKWWWGSLHAYHLGQGPVYTLDSSASLLCRRRVSKSKTVWHQGLSGNKKTQKGGPHQGTTQHQRIEGEGSARPCPSSAFPGAYHMCSFALRHHWNFSLHWCGWGFLSFFPWTRKKKWKDLVWPLHFNTYTQTPRQRRCWGSAIWSALC